jgi:hypothetical protein
VRVKLKLLDCRGVQRWVTEHTEEWTLVHSGGGMGNGDGNQVKVWGRCLGHEWPTGSKRGRWGEGGEEGRGGDSGGRWRRVLEVEEMRVEPLPY